MKLQRLLVGVVALLCTAQQISAATIGYTTTPASAVTLQGGVTENSRLMKTPSADFVAASGDTATQFAIYVNGGSGADSTVAFGLYNDASTTDPSAAVLRYSDTMVITAAMKASPGWYTKTISQSLTSFAGQTLRLAVAGVDAGTLAIGADSGAGTSSTSPGTHTLITPFGETTFNSTVLIGAYITVTSSSSTVVNPINGKGGAAAAPITLQ
jgi:hypothetical protein